MPHRNPPPGTKSGQVFVATGSIYRARDAGRAWYVHCKKVLEAVGFVASRLEQSFYYLPGPDELEAIAHTHVDDFLIAFRKAFKTYKDALKHLVPTFHMKHQSGTVDAVAVSEHVCWPLQTLLLNVRQRPACLVHHCQEMSKPLS